MLITLETAFELISIKSELRYKKLQDYLFILEKLYINLYFKISDYYFLRIY